MKHTPTPWDYDITAEGFNIYYEPAIKIIATVLYKEGLNNLPNKTESEANAKHIVKAVNSHDKLIEALKEIAEGKGRYDLDPLRHAANCIEDMKLLAIEAIKSCE